MLKKYIISKRQGQPYPFDGSNSYFQTVVVRIQLPISIEYQNNRIQEKIRILNKIKSHQLIRILRVEQIKNEKFRIDYEYVEDNIKRSHRIYQNGFLAAAKKHLHLFFNQLTDHKIKADIKIENIGLNSEGFPKVFLGFHFHIVQEDQINKLASQYQQIIDEIFQQNFGFINCLKTHSATHASEFSDRLDKKLMEIQGKIKKLKLKTIDSSQEVSSSSHRKLSKDRKQRNMVAHLQQSHQPNKSSINSTSSSVIESNQSMKHKVHKSSFSDYSTTSYRLSQQSFRQDSLKKRVSKALQKTQQAFQIYEKYSKGKKRF